MVAVKTLKGNNCITVLLYHKWKCSLALNIIGVVEQSKGIRIRGKALVIKFEMFDREYNTICYKIFSHFVDGGIMWFFIIFVVPFKASGAS